MTTLILRAASRRRLIAGFAAGLLAAPLAVPALAQAPSAPQPLVTLFNVVTPRDTMVIGVTAAEMAALGGSNPTEALARKIAAEGQMTVWHYVVGRGEGGALVMAPADKVALMAAGIVRIEAYRPAHPVVAPRS
jgi:hypothetical protein